MLRRLEDEQTAGATMAEIRSTLHERSGKLFAFGMLVVVVGVMLSIFQQFVGINAVLYYAPLMFKNMGSSTDTALLQTVIVGVANVVFTLIATATITVCSRAVSVDEPMFLNISGA